MTEHSSPLMEQPYAMMLGGAEFHYTRADLIQRDSLPSVSQAVRPANISDVIAFSYLDGRAIIAARIEHAGTCTVVCHDYVSSRDASEESDLLLPGVALAQIRSLAAQQRATSEGQR